MKKKLFSNKGSTMVMLVMAVAVISLLGTSILAVTMMNYKIKKANTDIKEAFYKSESGLDKAYEKAYMLIEEAVGKANGKAKEFIDYYEEHEAEIIEEIIAGGGEEHRRYFILSVVDTDITYSLDYNALQNEAKNVFESVYKDRILAEDAYAAESDIAEVIEGVSDSTLAVEIKNTPLSFSGNKLTVKIESQYTSDKGITRTTAVDMNISVANYNEAYTVEIKKIGVNPFWLKAVVAENLIIDGNSTFNGKVFVEKNVDVGASKVAFNNDLAVKGDVSSDVENSGIRLNSGNTLNVRNVYSRNILMNGTGAKFRADSPGSEIYVRDDLEINKPNQTVYINGSYYGFSDGGLYAGSDNSSGVNINEASGLSFTITKDLYLQGTSYVNVVNSSGNKYQTGESLSVKGNYRAYLQPLLSSYYSKDGKDISKVSFADYGHLRLADRFDDSSVFTAMHKADYMYFYQNNEYGDLSIPDGINVNGVVLGLGSVINDKKIMRSSYEISDRESFITFKNEYSRQTERLGYDMKAGGGSITGQLTFNNQINDNLITMSSEEIARVNNSDPLNYIYINNAGGSETLKSSNYKGLIITNGNLTISSNVESFEGAIICGGTVTIEVGAKTFTYNKDIVSKIIAENNLHTSVFSDSISVENMNITTFKTDETEGGKVDFSNLLKFANWKMK